jgi:hypothetical protein
MADELIIPPIQQSLEDLSSAKANGIDLPVTEKSWYLYWQRTGRLVNQQRRLITYGPHADRPDTGIMPPGALYMETDRSGVIYQNVDGVWQYVAGTMWGTLSPDQRPTDLGANDGGFTFRGTDQARQFLWSQSAWVEVTAVQYGTHAARPAPAGVADGVIYVESDRGNVIYQAQLDAASNPAWVYVSGMMRNTLANIPTDLGTNDKGFLFYGTDYTHTWRYTGSTWEYAPCDRISGEIAWFTADPGTGWALCNGSATTRTTATASTAAFTTPNLIGAYAKGAGTYTGGVAAAIPGTVSGSTGSESAHTHGVTTAAVQSGLGDIDSPIYAVSAGSGINVRNEWHRHNVPGQTVTSGTGSAHSHGTGTLAVSASEPAHVDLLPYFRR